MKVLTANRISAIALAVPVLVLQLGITRLQSELGLEAWGSAAAQQKEQQKPQETRRTPALRNKVYERLAEAQVHAEAKEYTKALNILRDMEDDSGKRALNSYELANLYNLQAFIKYSLEDYKGALRAYENVVSQPDIPLAMEINTRYTIAQLYFVQEQWRRGITALLQWFKVADTPSAQAYILIAQGYYQIKDYANSLKNTLTAVNMYKEKGKVPKEPWYSLLRYLYFERNDLPNTIATLEEMIIYYPKKQYWVQLSHMYSEAKDERKQLAAMEAVYVQDLLDKDREQVTMAYLYLNADVPYKAAKVLDKGITNKTVEASSKTLEILGNSWRQAQEVKKSIPVMEQAAAKSDKGELYVRLGSIYLNNDEYAKAVKAIENGLKRGGVKRVDNANLALGMAAFNNKQYSKARKAFNAAARDKRSRRHANQWLAYMQNELDRQRKLAEEA